MSLVLYDGPSRLDSKTHVLLLATDRSHNRKTGSMLQTWALLANTDPINAVRTNQDDAICGQCIHRGNGFANRSCYVNIAFGPRGAWRGKRELRTAPEQRKATGRNQFVRLGAYGDPAAIPFEVWAQLLEHAAGWTGYTHQWRTCDQRLKQFCMASVENESELLVAQTMGWRTYRVTHPNAAPLEREVLCPASEEAGKKLTCAQCLYCSGGDLRGSVYIPVHGTAYIKNAFLRAAPLASGAESLGSCISANTLIAPSKPEDYAGHATTAT